MSAEIESIAYVGATPWHGLGVELKEAPTPQHLLKQAGLNWTVSKRPIWTADESTFATKPCGTNLMFNNLYALVRDSDNSIFGVCGPAYQPFQNGEVFEFFNKFTEAGNMKMEVAGSLKNGRWIWALARLEEGAFTLTGNDKNYTYLLLCSPHIWGEALTIMFTSIRVVCWNTLTAALNKAVSGKFKAVHNRGFADVKGLAALSVEHAMVQKAVYEQKAKLLSQQKIVDVTALYNYIATLIQPDLVTKGDADSADFHKTAQQILYNYHTAPGSELKSAKGTWWGAFNAVTYYFDHQVGVRSVQDTRLYNAWVGHTTSVVKRKALELAVTMAQAA